MGLLKGISTTQLAELDFVAGEAWPRPRMVYLPHRGVFPVAAASRKEHYGIC